MISIKDMLFATVAQKKMHVYTKKYHKPDGLVGVPGLPVELEGQNEKDVVGRENVVVDPVFPAPVDPEGLRDVEIDGCALLEPEVPAVPEEAVLAPVVGFSVVAACKPSTRPEGKMTNSV